MTLLDVFRAHPATYRPLLDYHEAVMRGPSAFTVAERELMAAYVSGLNACGYCLGVHRVTAERFGVDRDLLDGLLTDLDHARGVDDRMRAVLRYVGQLTVAPAALTRDDAVAVLEAGWGEDALHDAASVCGLFNLMNRIVDGMGVTADDDYLDISGRRLAEGGYAALKELL
ncbi:MAG: hypothetical protein AVDCRST_MAG32-2799 [uncultured Nocardioides sp.]|uniref:Carboxymuconolactone decarboxylase-like domain-containing protein n=1 Tax=uncultured Nocardioides sp. TaxID=198441 RepID=A0A6J4NUE2_9ACTN|nr:MAG: hypothetical protein AVDCRST_MAG32-2799 [uncultured Nocardioides sp.]